MPHAVESAESSGPVTSFASFDGTTIRCRRIGAGPPAVLVHGSGGGLHSWPLGALIDHIGHPVHLVGTSYGSSVALHAAAAGPPIRSLALWEPPALRGGCGTGARAGRVRGAGRQGRAAAGGPPPRRAARPVGGGRADRDAPAGKPAQGPGPDEGPDDAFGWCRDPESMAGDTADVRRWSAVTVPTPLMRGADTWQPVPETFDTLAAALPRVTVATFPGRTHFAPSAVPGGGPGG